MRLYIFNKVSKNLFIDKAVEQLVCNLNIAIAYQPYKEYLSWKGALRRRILGPLWITGWPWASSVTLGSRRPRVSWGASRRVWPGGQDQFSSLFTLPFTCRILCPVLGFSVQKRGIFKAESSRGQQRWLGTWSIFSMRKGWETWDSSILRTEGISSLFTNT